MSGRPNAVPTWARRLWPDSLAGRLIALLLLALVASQLLALYIFASERRHALLDVSAEELLVRTAGLVRILADTDPALHRRILRATSSPRLGYRLTSEGPPPPFPESRSAPRLSAKLASLIGPGGYQVEVRRRTRDWDRWEEEGGREERLERRRDEDRRDGWKDGRRRHERAWMTVSVRLPSGEWLLGASGIPPPPPGWAWQTLLSLGIMAAAIVLVTVFAVRRAARPLGRLAEAADRLGRGDSPGALPEEGPAEVRRSTVAFNRMRERLERFVKDRTQMLAAMSHDLRTPITTLRLRAEFIDDEETREKILETLDEMQRMVEESLAFIREEAQREPSREVDVAALLDSLCADLRDLGLEAELEGQAEAQRCPLSCRPAALKRALRNLIENAARYGKVATVRLEACRPEVVIVIEDKGPGIPEAELERVFEPFVRLEESRSRETGGVGLGLAIARSILRGHGGEVRLANREGGGLQARITLPRS